MWLLTICLYLGAFLETNALYFFLKEGNEKCFLQELAKETLLLAHYKCSLSSPSNNSQIKEHSMMVEIKDPRKQTVLSRPYRSNGMFSYKSHEPGEHIICLRTEKKHFFKHKIRIDFDLQVGTHAMNRSVHKQQQMHLTDLEKQYQQLLDQAIEMDKETDYLRYREELFRGTTETISYRVLLWMIGETVLLIVIAVWQMEHLRKFFESKKLV